MIYGACLPTGRADHLESLWKMLSGLLPKFRDSGRCFFGADDALLIPHAIDDLVQIVGNFWTGMIDQGCVAWLGLMAWQHYRYTLRKDILVEIALPLLAGAFGGFWAMFYEQNGRRFLPVTVSPEFRGSQRDVWGENASFQIAAFQLTARLLPQVAAILGREVDPRWALAAVLLPAFSSFQDGPVKRMGIWDGQDLEECHRHHSHLASIHPFRTVDVYAPELQAILSRTIRHWHKNGAGEWAGWSVPWAAQIVARCGLVDAAVGWLKWQSWVYTNPGYNALHNAGFSGNVAWDDGSLDELGFQHSEAWPGHIMQTDAAMGAVSAICDLFVQNEPSHLGLMQSLPKGWRSFQVKNLAAEGGVKLSLSAERGAIEEVSILATHDTHLILEHGMLSAEDNGRRVGGILDREMQAGEVFVINRLRGAVVSGWDPKNRPLLEVAELALQSGDGVVLH